MSALQYWLMGGTLAGGLMLFGAIIALSYAWYPDVVREQLGTLLAEGRMLLRIAQLEQEPVPLFAAEEWNQRVAGYLASAIGRSFARRFSAGSRLPASESTLPSDTRRALELDLRNRITRLEQFLSELGLEGLSSDLGPGSRVGQQWR
jgi:hypothetical protein